MTIRPKMPAFPTIRMKKGFSQRKLAIEAKLSSPFISQLEQGKRAASPDSAKKICDALGVEFEEIFFIESACKSEHACASA